MSQYARRAGEAWAECGICGFDFPQSQMFKHYKYGFLVDVGCSDELAATDYMETLRLPETERSRPTRQRVPDQGKVVYEAGKWNKAQWNVDNWEITAGPETGQPPQ